MGAWSKEQLAHLVLRIGVAFAFLYPPYAALSDPISWYSYFPSFVRVIPLDIVVMLHIFGAIEVIIALWILSGKNIRYPALVAALMLCGIVAFNLTNFDVVFRDLSIAAMALALALWPKPAITN